MMHTLVSVGVTLLVVVLCELRGLGSGFSILRDWRRKTFTSTLIPPAHGNEQQKPSSFLQPSHFTDPAFSTGSVVGGNSNKNSTNPQYGIPSRFIDPAFSSGSMSGASNSNATNQQSLMPSQFTDPAFSTGSAVGGASNSNATNQQSLMPSQFTDPSLSSGSVVGPSNNATTNPQSEIPSQFTDPAFYTGSAVGGASNGNVTIPQSGIPSHFMPPFLDPSKVSQFGKQQNQGYNPGFSASLVPNGTASLTGQTGGLFYPDLFTNPGTGSSNGFNLMNPGQFVGRK